MEDWQRTVVQLESEVRHLVQSLERFEKELEERVTIWRYRPVEMIAYGLVSCLAGAVVTGLILKVWAL